MAKTEKINVTLPIELRKRLTELAKKENRNVSNMVTVLILKGMEKEKAA
jgi:predicted DNA-binding protein